MSFCSMACYRELDVFTKSFNNLLAYVAQITVVFAYGAALVIATGLNEGINPLLFGTILIAANLVLLVLSVTMAMRRHYVSMNRERQWWQVLNTAEFAVVEKVMQAGSFAHEIAARVRAHEGAAGVGDGGGGDSGTGTSVLAPRRGSARRMSGGASKASLARVRSGSAHVLKSDALAPADVELHERVGSGAFGEVFRGTCRGELVAVKTVKGKVTEENIQDFRRETLLTASLHHPCIVGFVGACWDKALTCLVLEWIPLGSLGGYLADELAGLTWAEPLLRLASDVARGMAYLHNQAGVEGRRCVLHRDLKPDNGGAQGRAGAGPLPDRPGARHALCMHDRAAFSLRAGLHLFFYCMQCW